MGFLYVMASSLSEKYLSSRFFKRVITSALRKSRHEKGFSDRLLDNRILPGITLDG